MSKGARTYKKIVTRKLNPAIHYLVNGASKCGHPHKGNFSTEYGAVTCFFCKPRTPR
jgi:hypothetical protein